MSGLSAFLSENVVVEENIKFAASKRFLDKDKNPMKWEIKSITSEEDEEIRRSCTKKVQVTGKRGQFTKETDFDMYLGKLAVKCTVFPNLNDAELQNSYGVMGADKLLKKMLKPGEYATYCEKIQEVNGFETTIDELVEEAKN
ncbi:MAG: phage tail assembly chaperone [Alkaliphilus sp.]